VFDLVSKHFVTQTDQHISLNKGISFGWFETHPVIMILLVAGIFFFYCYSFFDTILKFPVWNGLFLGGAAANILDRLIFGAVRDWLTLPFVGLQNNFADWAIFIGMLGIIGKLLFDTKQINKEYTEK